MKVQNAIESKLRENIQPDVLEVLNESHMHNVPPGSESHFKVLIVSGQFEGVSRVKRQQLINGLLADELEGPVHALSMQTLTPAEWEMKNGEMMASPQCLGGGKTELAS